VRAVGHRKSWAGLGGSWYAAERPLHFSNKEARMSNKRTGPLTGNSEAIRIYEAMEEERKRKLEARAEAAKPKKITLPRVPFLDKE
jgi:hypothetical protein